MCLMKVGMKHSLCLISIVSKAHPSESMPMRKSCLRAKRSSGLSVIVYSEESNLNHRGTEAQRRHTQRRRKKGKGNRVRLFPCSLLPFCVVFSVPLCLCG